MSIRSRWTKGSGLPCSYEKDRRREQEVCLIVRSGQISVREGAVLAVSGRLWTAAVSYKHHAARDKVKAHLSYATRPGSPGSQSLWLKVKGDTLPLSRRIYLE